MNNELENWCSTNVGFERKSTAMIRHNRINPLSTSARPFNQLGCKTNLQAFSFHPLRFTQQCGVSATMRNKVVFCAYVAEMVHQVCLWDIPCQLTSLFCRPSLISLKFGMFVGLDEEMSHTKFQVSKSNNFCYMKVEN